MHLSLSNTKKKNYKITYVKSYAINIHSENIWQEESK